MESQRKQAVLLLIHDNFNYVEKLLKLMDSPYFDFFVHVDKSSDIQKMLEVSLQLKQSQIFFTSNRLLVRWGDFSIVEAEILLLRLSFETGKYSYYHLLSGSDFILKTPKQIFNLFNKDYPKEYVNFWKIPDNKLSFYNNRYLYRYKKRYPAKKSLCNKFLYQAYIKFIQKSRKKIHSDVEFKLGSQWFSITDLSVKYLLSQEEEIRNLYSNTIVPDESFLQTIISRNTELMVNNVRSPEKYSSIRREIIFINGKPKVWTDKDIEYLVQSDAFFARKFMEGTSDSIIDYLYNTLQEEKNNGN